MEPASFTFTIIDYTIQLISAIRVAVQEDRQNEALFSSLKSRITRIRGNFQLFCLSPNFAESAVYVNVEERIRNDFILLKGELETVGLKMKKTSRIRRVLTAGQTGENMREILSRLDSLERHLDMFGLMKDMRQSFHEILQMPPAPTQALLDPSMLEFLNNQQGVLNEIIRKLESVTNGSQSRSQLGDSTDHDPDSHVNQRVAEQGLDSHEKHGVENMISLPKLLRELTRRLEESNLPTDFKNAAKGMIDRFQRRWSLDIHDISFEKGVTGDKVSVGQGGFSNVYKAELQLRGMHGMPEGAPVKVAVKQLNISRTDLAHYKADVFREIHLLTECNHPCIIHNYGAFWPEKSENEDALCTEEYFPPMIVMERMTCDLGDALKSAVFKDVKIRKRILIDVAEALKYLHGRNVVHRDVKPENVLIRVLEQQMIGSAKLSDFGVSREVHTTKYLATQTLRSDLAGTIMYMPPEVLLEPTRFITRRSWDVWSLGLLICVLCGQKEAFSLTVTPLTAKTLAETGQLARAAKMYAKSISDEALQMAALRCLEEDWKKRATVTEVIALLKGEKTKFQQGREMYSEFLRDRDIGAGRKAAELFRAAWQEGEEKAAQWLAQCQQNELVGTWSDSVATYEEGCRRGNPVCSYKLGLHRLVRSQTKSECEQALNLLRELKDINGLAAFVGALWRVGLEEFGSLLCLVSDSMRCWDNLPNLALPDAWSVEDGCPPGVMKQVEDALKSSHLDDIVRADLLCWKAVWAFQRSEALSKDREMLKRYRRQALSGLLQSVKLGNCEALAVLGVAFEEFEIEISTRSDFEDADLSIVNGVSADKAAFYCIRQSAERGSLLGMCCLAKCYIRGDGVRGNVERGTKWLRKAADKGSRFAVKMLEELDSSLEATSANGDT